MASNPRILLVEDDVLIGMMLVDMFDALAERGIPFAFTSGGGDVIPPAHAHRKLITKPFRISDIEAALGDFSAE